MRLHADGRSWSAVAGHHIMRLREVDGLSAALLAHAAVASMTGLLLGFDLCIAGAILTPVQRSLHLCYPCVNTSDAALAACSCAEKEFVISAVSIGAMFGALLGGVAADVFGRRIALCASDAMFAAGGVAMACAQPTTKWLFFCGRVLVGLALGIGGSASSAYLAEIAPTRLRGRFLEANELCVCAGCLAAYGIAYALGDANWRLSMAGTAVVALAQMCGVCCVHESPRWLIMKGRTSHAARATAALHCHTHLSHQRFDAASLPSSDDTPAAARACGDDAGPSRSLTEWTRSLRASRRPLMLALGIAAAHAVTAANTVLYYSRDVLQLAGVSQPLLASTAVGVVKLIGVALALALADRTGRRPLLLSGTAVMVVSLWGLAAAFHDASRPVPGLALTSLLLFILGWDISWAGLMLTVIAEVLPQRTRAAGVGVAYALYWALAFVSSQLFETAFGAIGVAQTFAAIGLACAVVWLWTWRCVPETANVPLERTTQHESSSGGGTTPAAEPAGAAVQVEAAAALPGVGDGDGTT